MWKFPVTLASVFALLITFSAAAYADGDGELYKSESNCWHDANLKTTATGGEDHYSCAYTTHADAGQADCHPPPSAARYGCLGNYWRLEEAGGGGGPHAPEEPEGPTEG
jgi:hypothetical protein